MRKVMLYFGIIMNLAGTVWMAIEFTGAQSMSILMYGAGITFMLASALTSE